MTREEKIRKKIQESKKYCIHNIVDGCGNYCPFIPIPLNVDYPHKFYRADCYGRFCNCKRPELYKEK
jgi:hypothetical protein